MSLILAAAPGIDRFHLMDRLFRELQSRGRRTETLCVDAADHEFWLAQGHTATFARPQAPVADRRWARVPFAEFAAIDCRLKGVEPEGQALLNAERRLRRIAQSVFQRFENDRPDIVLFHQRRTGAHALIQFAAREAGCVVQWTGDGVLPGTMQIDPDGMDGDAPSSRRSAWDFRDGPIDDALLRSAIAGAAGQSQPLPLPRAAVKPPPLLPRVIASWDGRREGTAPGFLRSLGAWRDALPQLAHPAATIDLPKSPFVVALLQRADDPRVLLDAEDAPSPVDLVRAARRAAAALDRAAEVVAVLPREGLDPRHLQQLRSLDGLHIELRHAAPAACMAAAAVVTINDPHAGLALIADTPTLHMGRAVYGTPGVAHATTVEELAPTLRAAVREPRDQLRRRFLTQLLHHGHLWCSPDQPDHNGISGWVLRIEQATQRPSHYGADLRYRAGPAWPLASESK